MIRSMISGGSLDGLKVSFVFLWIAFLLFPVAHLGISRGIPVYWSEMAIGGSFLILILHDPKRVLERFACLFREEPRFFLFVGLFLAGIVFAYALNPHSLSSLGEIKSFYIVPVLFLVAILVHAETKRWLESIAFGWLLGLAAASLVGVMAYMSGWFSYDGRLTSLYLSPNYLAMLVAPGLLLAVYFSFTARSDFERYRLGAFFSGALILFTLWATRSYAAWGATLLALGVFFWHIRGPRIHIASFLIVVGVLMGVLLHEQGTEKWQSLVSGNERSSIASRLMIWRASFRIAHDSFPIGIGTGRFQEAYLANQSHFPPYLEWAVPTPHNLYLHFLLEGGVATLIGWLGCAAIVVRRVAQRLFRRSGDGLLALGLALAVFYLVYGLVDTPYMKNDLALAVWGSLGLSLAALRVRA